MQLLGIIAHFCTTAKYSTIKPLYLHFIGPSHGVSLSAVSEVGKKPFNWTTTWSTSVFRGYCGDHLRQDIWQYIKILYIVTWSAIQAQVYLYNHVRMFEQFQNQTAHLFEKIFCWLIIKSVWKPIGSLFFWPNHSGWKNLNLDFLRV